ncbi:MAG: peptidoglycan DD-metalloendopeptidase family protein, partial [Actinomycetes bacterium]
QYGARPGRAVWAIGDGVVFFAGAVGGRLVVSIEHPDGRRSTLTHLSVILTRRGASVRQGQVVGLAAAGLHLGVIERGNYVDPARLFRHRVHAVLVRG